MTLKANLKTSLAWVLSTLLSALMFGLVVYYVVTLIVSGLMEPLVTFVDAEFNENGVAVYQPGKPFYCPGETLTWEPRTLAMRDADVTVWRTIKAHNPDGTTILRSFTTANLSLEAGDFVTDEREHFIPDLEIPGEYYLFNSFSAGTRTARYIVFFNVGNDCQ